MHVLVVGESVVDVIHTPSGTTRRAGGSCANVAVGLARLGVETTLLTSYGCDDDGRLLDDFLMGVEVIRVDGPTSTATAAIGSDGSAAYDFDVAWALDGVAASLPSADHIHAGSIGAVLQPGADAVLNVLRQHRGSVSYDPNWRPSLMHPGMRSRAEEIVRRADVVKLSEEDALAMYPAQRPEVVAATWRQRGPQLVVLTRGAGGAEAWTVGGGHRHVAARPVTVVDTVGAGDAFMAAALWAWLTDNDADTDRTLQVATAAAALTCERSGADPPGLERLKDLLGAGHS